jgi:hypothetical protein
LLQCDGRLNEQPVRAKQNFPADRQHDYPDPLLTPLAEVPQPGKEETEMDDAKEKPLVDQMTVAAGELAKTAVKAVAKRAKKAVAKRTPETVKIAAKAVAKAANAPRKTAKKAVKKVAKKAEKTAKKSPVKKTAKKKKSKFKKFTKSSMTATG